MVTIDQLKNLSPEERIKLLKELQKSKKDEIEQARKLIVQSEQEIEHEIEITKHVPIPQVKAVNIEGLFSHEEKQVFKATRYVSEKPKLEEEAVLEETVKKEEPKEHIDQRQYQMVQQLVEETRDIYNRAKQEIETLGYLKETRGPALDVYERNKQVTNTGESMMEATNAGERMMRSLMDWYKK